MVAETASPSFVDCLVYDAKEVWSFASDSYEIFREEIVKSLQAKVPPAQKILIDRISRSVASTFVAMCAISGSWGVPAVIVFVVHRGLVLYEFLREAFQVGTTNEGLLQVWRRVKEEYKRVLEEEIAPALLVALAVDTLFSFVIGISLPSLRLILRVGLVSLPMTYFWYNMLVEKCGVAAAQGSLSSEVRQEVVEPS